MGRERLLTGSSTVLVLAAATLSLGGCGGGGPSESRLEQAVLERPGLEEHILREASSRSRLAIALPRSNPEGKSTKERLQERIELKIDKDKCTRVEGGRYRCTFTWIAKDRQTGKKTSDDWSELFEKINGRWKMTI